MDKQKLAAKIWASANKMRSKIEANEYKDYILGFIFYKFLSEKEVTLLKTKKGWDDEDIKEMLTEKKPKEVKFVQDEIGYFIAYDNLFSTWRMMGNQFTVGNVRDALNAFNRLIHPNYYKVFAGKDGSIFKPLSEGLSKLGTSTSDQTDACSKIMEVINDIPMSTKQDYDVLGFVYEYLIRNFAANAGKKAGEFYTPSSVVQMMSQIITNHLKDHDSIRIYDCCSGSGGLLLNVGEELEAQTGKTNSVRYYAQEYKVNTYNLTRMNLIMRGVLPDHMTVRCGDSLDKDWPYFEEDDNGNPKEETYRLLSVDAVSMNPPYSQEWEQKKLTDPRFKDYGIAPKGKADYAFLLHGLYHLNSTGIMTIVLPHGVLSRGLTESDIRRQLVEFNNIDAIIGLPGNIFYNTTIPTIVMVLKKQRELDDILIIDASRSYVKVGKNNELRACDIKKIVDTVIGREEIDHYSRRVSRDLVRQNNYNLNIPRYIDSGIKDEPQDIYANMFGGVPNSEIDDLKDFWKEYPDLRSIIFKPLNDSYSEVQVDSINGCIFNNEQIKSFKSAYSNSFADIKEMLISKLLSDPENVSQGKTKDEIVFWLFNHIEPYTLLDKYDAYQIFSNSWQGISKDLEVIHSEGINCCKVVDDIQKIKKKDGKVVLDANKKPVEVHDYYEGHIIPMVMIQKHFYSEDLKTMMALSSQVSEMDSRLAELISLIPDEGKTEDLWDAEKDSLITKEFEKCVKELKARIKKGAEFEEMSFEWCILQISDVKAEKSKVNKKLSALKKALEEKTINKIETLSDDEIDSMLIEKWIEPIVEGINAMPDDLLNSVVDKLDYLAHKYEYTLDDTSTKISTSKTSLAAMLAGLSGNTYDQKGINEFIRILKGGKNE